jgi:hypothetical protein
MKNLKVCPGELAHGVQWRKYDKPRRITPDVTSHETGQPGETAASGQRDSPGLGGVTTVSTYQVTDRYAKVKPAK